MSVSGGTGGRLANLEHAVERVGDKVDTLDEKVVVIDKKVDRLEPLPGLLRWAIGLLVPAALGFAVSVVLLIPK